MSSENSVEVEFVAPEAQITLEGNCVHDGTGTFKVLTVPYEVCAELGDTLPPPRREQHDRRRVPRI